MPEVPPDVAPDVAADAGSAGSDRTSGAAGEAPGLRAQLRATRDAFRGLISAHVELARAEFGEIVAEISRVAAAAGVALAMLVGIAIILPVGLLLFLGDWLFGSIGWGVLDGVLLLAAIATFVVVAAVGSSRGELARDFAIALFLGIFVGIVLSFDLANQAWARLAGSLRLEIDTATAPLVVGVAVLAIVGAVLGLIAGARGGGSGSAVGGLIGGAILGAVIGAISAVTFSHRVGAALGTTVGLLAWPVLSGGGLIRRGIDTDALKARFLPNATIETTKETIEWVRAQTPLGRKS